MASDVHILKKILETVDRQAMLGRGDRVLVALSGGPDSVCLLHVLNRLRARLDIRLAAAHFDHGLRPAEDEREALFTEDLARSLDIPYEAGRWGLATQPKKGSLEERAREARYGFLSSAAKRHDCRRIALGHTLNDQAETVLMRLLRGSGPAGLGGIPPCRDGGFIRPLIEVDRKTIEGYLARHGLTAVVDSSNADQRFFRNRVRRELVPLMEDYQPNIVRRLGRVARIMREDEDWMTSAAADWLAAEAEMTEAGAVAVPLPAFHALPHALKNRILREALRWAGGTLRGVGAGHIDSVRRMMEGSRPQARLALPNRISVRRVYDRLTVAPFDEAPVGAFSHRLNGPGVHYLKALHGRISLRFEAPPPLPPARTSRWTAFLDGDRVQFPLTLRSFLPGDRFVPLGMAGRKKVKAFFIDLKLPTPDRARIPLLTRGDDVMWVCGYRIDDRFKVRTDSRAILRVVFEPRSTRNAGNHECSDPCA